MSFFYSLSVSFEQFYCPSIHPSNPRFLSFCACVDGISRNNRNTATFVVIKNKSGLFLEFLRIYNLTPPACPFTRNWMVQLHQEPFNTTLSFVVLYSRLILVLFKCSKPKKQKNSLHLGIFMKKLNGTQRYFKVACLL